MYGQNKYDNAADDGKHGVIITTAATTLTAAQSGSTVFHNSANTALTLPAAKAGLNFKIILGIEALSGCNILTASNADCFFGYIHMKSDTTDQIGVPQQITYAVAVAAPASYDAMKFIAATTTIGGVAGEVISLTCVSDEAWHVEIPDHATSDNNPGTAALIVAAMKVKASDSKCVAGDTFQMCFINGGTAGADESCTMTAGTGVTVVGNAEVENLDTASDAISSGSSLWAVHVTVAKAGSEAVSIIRLA